MSIPEIFATNLIDKDTFDMLIIKLFEEYYDEVINVLNNATTIKIWQILWKMDFTYNTAFRNL